jgi:hypothetical protein
MTNIVKIVELYRLGVMLRQYLSIIFHNGYETPKTFSNSLSFVHLYLVYI